MNATSHHLLPRNRRDLLAMLAFCLGLGELADSFFVSFWIGALVFAVLFGLAGAWTRRGGLAGPLFVGVLCIFELQSFPTWERSGIGDWIHQIAFIAVAAATLVLSAMVAKQALHSRKARSAGAEA